MTKNKDVCEGSYTDVNITLPMYDEYIKEFNFKIYGFNSDESEVETCIGTGKGHIFPFTDEQTELIELADTCNQACYELCSEVELDQIGELATSGFIIIESMKIKEPFRGNEIGLDTMKTLINFFWNYTILIKPRPLNGSCKESELENGVKKLQKYWAKCGFKKSGNSQIFYKECI